jgi:thiol:disulfide interchange protein
VQVFVLAGLAGVILVAVVLLMLAFRLWCLRGITEPAEWNLAGAVLMLAIGASLGMPSLTANRAVTLLWLVLGIFIAAQSAGSSVSRPPHRRAPATPSPQPRSRRAPPPGTSAPANTLLS